MDNRNPFGATLTKAEREALKLAADRMRSDEMARKFGATLTRAEKEAMGRKGRKSRR